MGESSGSILPGKMTSSVDEAVESCVLGFTVPVKTLYNAIPREHKDFYMLGKDDARSVSLHGCCRPAWCGVLASECCGYHTVVAACGLMIPASVIPRYLRTLLDGRPFSLVRSIQRERDRMSKTKYLISNPRASD